MCPVGAIEEASSNIPTAARFFLIFAAVLFFRITEKSLPLQSKLLLLPLWARLSVY